MFNKEPFMLRPETIELLVLVRCVKVDTRLNTLRLPKYSDYTVIHCVFTVLLRGVKV